jgi:HD-GYP domain-containing protein (c-di-GMP phosphodiesterase class II)
MLTVPLKNIEEEVVGVLQLMNKKSDASVKLTTPEIVEQVVTDFSYSDEEFLQSIGALAAVSIERTQLYENIEQIFEGFLGSSIAAIDERDRVTSGHSRRVMGYAMALVEAINKAEEGVFAQVRFTEDSKRQFKFAALLHDIGKIGVPEAILNKEHRLPKDRFVSIVSRFDTIRYQLLFGHPEDALRWTSVDELESDRSFVERINKAGFIRDEDLERLESLKDKYYKNSEGKKARLIEENEWKALSVRRGNLTTEERDMINSHAISSYRILSKIPWTPDLEDIPEIAAHHHEKLDGTGYPDGLKKDQVRLEDKILAIIDIYDAIVAQDRPYKPAMPPSKAISILREEAKSGHLDPDLVEFFIGKDIYKMFSD